MLNAGTKIKNGATILQARDNVALCFWPRTNEFVVWYIDSDLEAHCGAYAKTFDRAWVHFERRTGGEYEEYLEPKDENTTKFDRQPAEEQ